MCGSTFAGRTWAQAGRWDRGTARFLHGRPSCGNYLAGNRKQSTGGGFSAAAQVTGQLINRPRWNAAARQRGWICRARQRSGLDSTAAFDQLGTSGCATSWPTGRSFGWVWDPVAFSRAAFRDRACRRLCSRRIAAGNAVGGHRTLNKTDVLLCRSLTAVAVRTRTRIVWFDSNKRVAAHGQTNTSRARRSGVGQWNSKPPYLS
jgi:hypothetical protein